MTTPYVVDHINKNHYDKNMYKKTIGEWGITNYWYGADEDMCLNIDHLNCSKASPKASPVHWVSNDWKCINCRKKVPGGIRLLVLLLHPEVRL